VEEVVHSKAVICLVQDEVYQQARLALDSYKNLPFPIFIPFSKTMSPHQKFGGGDLLDIMIKGIRLKATGAW
jgi:hypothetical protein